MKAQIKRAAVLVVGWTFILVGIVGLFLPVLQGMLFIFIGLLILSSEYVWAHSLLQKIRRKFPKVAHWAELAEERARGWLGKITGKGRKAGAVGADD